MASSLRAVNGMMETIKKHPPDPGGMLHFFNQIHAIGNQGKQAKKKFELTKQAKKLIKTGLKIFFLRVLHFPAAVRWAGKARNWLKIFYYESKIKSGGFLGPAFYVRLFDLIRLENCPERVPGILSSLPARRDLSELDRRLLAGIGCCFTGDFKGAEQNLQSALLLTGGHPDLVMDTRKMLLAMYFQFCRYDEAIEQLFYLKLPQRCQNAQANLAPVGCQHIHLAGKPADGACLNYEETTRLAFLFDAYDQIIAKVLNERTDFAVAGEISLRKNNLKRTLTGENPEISTGPLILSPDWVRNIGHICLLDFLEKMRRLGWRKWSKMVVLAPEQNISNPDYQKLWPDCLGGFQESGREIIANKAYLKLWEPYFTVVRDPQEIDQLLCQAALAGERIAHFHQLPGGPLEYFCESLGRIQNAWRASLVGPLLQCPPEIARWGWTCLGQMGLPPGGWFVCLHTREPDYHGEWETDHQAHRNADIRDYLPAIKAIIARGGWVIRMGDPSMRKLPRMKQVIDYAHAPQKADWMDVFLTAHCKFFVGGASGFTHMPFTFGTPCVVTNWCSNAYPPAGDQDLFLPKLLRCQDSGQLLPFRDMFQRDTRNACYAVGGLKARRLTAVDNTPEELCEIVTEMLDRLEGRGCPDEDSRRRQRLFQHTAEQQGVIGCSEVGQHFLEKYARLLA